MCCTQRIQKYDVNRHADNCGTVKIQGKQASDGGTGNIQGVKRTVYDENTGRQETNCIITEIQ